jgi:hypothetical protein
VRWLPIAMAIVLAIFATAASESAAVGKETLTYEIADWGHHIHYWHVESDGNGEIRTFERSADGENLTEKRYKFKIPTRDFKRVRSILAEFVIGKTKATRCNYIVPDLPYGNLSWQTKMRVGRIDLNYGCPNKKEQKNFVQIARATALLEQAMIRDELPFETKVLSARGS